MRRASFYLLMSGCTLLLAALWFALPPTVAQDTPEYIGASECSDCHADVYRTHRDAPHHRALVDVEDAEDKATILGDFSQGDDVRQVTFPGSAPRAFTADDVVFAVGAGRYVQRYLYRVEENEYLVLPAEWNIAEQRWQPFTLAEAWPSEAYDWELNCAYCHTTGFDPQRGRWEDDGVRCEACHGPGEAHADAADDAGSTVDEEELVEVRATIYLGVDPQVCGQCHSRGLGEGRPFSAGYLPGGTLLADATYTLVAADDPTHWWLTGHASQPNMQFNEWVVGGHAASLTPLKDNAAEVQPACLTCHSSDYPYVEGLRARVAAGEREGAAPDALTIETTQWGVSCTSCHNVHSENTTHNAFITAEPYELCASCHSDPDPSDGLHHAMRQMYEGAQLIDVIRATPSAHFTAEDGPDCVTCHMPEVPTENGLRSSHVMRVIEPGAVLTIEGLEDSCLGCHEDQVNGEQMQQLIDDIKIDTRSRVERARAALTTGAPAWVTLALDLVEGDGSWGVHNYTYADALLDTVEVELGLATQDAAAEEAGS